MKVRSAVDADLPEVTAMALAFAKWNPHHVILALRPDLITVRVTQTFHDGIILVAEREKGELTGFIALVSGRHETTGQFMLAETGFWVKPFYRRGRSAERLLQAAEDCCRNVNATVLRIGSLCGEVAFGDFLGRRGFTPIETHHCKLIE